MTALQPERTGFRRGAQCRRTDASGQILGPMGITVRLIDLFLIEMVSRSVSNPPSRVIVEAFPAEDLTHVAC